MVTNLLRHLENVEKVARFSDEWRDIVRNTVKARRSKEANDINFGMFADHPESELNSIFIFPCMFMFKTIINLMALH